VTSGNPSKKSSAGTLNEGEDYYQLLGVAYSATRQEITKAYRQAMKHAHPDRRLPEHRAGAEERAKLLNQAYTVLTHPETKRKYDESIKVNLVQNQIMNQYFGGFGAPGGLGADRFGESLRREATAEEKGERSRANRSAIVTILFIFGGMAVAIVLALLLWTVLSALVSALV
jgi:DnaJ-class molecular chaperone